MTTRRSSYFAVLLLALSALLLARTWANVIFFCAVAALPLLSLALSLRAMRAARAQIIAPQAVTRGQSASVAVRVTGGKYTPPWMVKMRQTNSFSAKKARLRPDEPLPTAHCGTIRVAVGAVYALDDMGLFRVRLCPRAYLRVAVRPEPKPPKTLPELHLSQELGVRPVRGGISEANELRAYQPGDELRRIHWKLSAKTGTLILREPVAPVRRELLLRMELAGTPDELDDKLARLLWLSRYLLEKGHPHGWQVLTAQGVTEFFIEDEQTLCAELDALLDCAPARGGSVLDAQAHAAQWYYIGGDGDEAQ